MSTAVADPEADTALETPVVAFDPYVVELKTVPGISFFVADKLVDQGLRTIGQFVDSVEGRAEVDLTEEVKIACPHVAEFMRHAQGDADWNLVFKKAPAGDGGICQEAAAAIADGGFFVPVGKNGLTTEEAESLQAFLSGNPSTGAEPSKPGAMTSDEERQCLERHRAECIAALQKVREADNEVERLKIASKAAKESLEARQNILNDLVGRDPFAPTQAVLFKADADAPADGTASPTPAPGDEPVIVDDEAWRSVRLDGPFFGPKLGDTIVKAFFEADVQTLGQFTDFTAEKGEWWHKELKGVGPKKRETIENVCAEFWAERDAQAAPATE